MPMAEPKSRCSARTCRLAFGPKTMKRAPGKPCVSWLHLSRTARLVDGQGSPMRVLIDGNVHDPLSPAEEQDVRQFRPEESVQGSVLSADEATKARVGQTKRVLAIFWGLVAVAAAGIASLAEPADLPVVLTAAVVAVGALGAFFAFMVWR